MALGAMLAQAAAAAVAFEQAPAAQPSAALSDGEGAGLAGGEVPIPSEDAEGGGVGDSAAAGEAGELASLHEAAALSASVAAAEADAAMPLGSGEPGGSAEPAGEGEAGQVAPSQLGLGDVQSKPGGASAAAGWSHDEPQSEQPPVAAPEELSEAPETALPLDLAATFVAEAEAEAEPRSPVRQQPQALCGDTHAEARSWGAAAGGGDGDARADDPMMMSPAPAALFAMATQQDSPFWGAPVHSEQVADAAAPAAAVAAWGSPAAGLVDAGASEELGAAAEARVLRLSLAALCPPEGELLEEDAELLEEDAELLACVGAAAPAAAAPATPAAFAAAEPHATLEAEADAMDAEHACNAAAREAAPPQQLCGSPIFAGAGAQPAGGFAADSLEAMEADMAGFGFGGLAGGSLLDEDCGLGDGAELGLLPELPHVRGGVGGGKRGLRRDVRARCGAWRRGRSG
jgi:hypothetical protein